MKKSDLTVIDANGNNGQKTLIAVNGNASHIASNKFVFLRADDMLKSLKPVDWLVKGYVERNSMAVIYGESGHGKSFVAIDMACCVATGTDWHGHPVKAGAVFYIAGEGHNGLTRRLNAWIEARGVSLTGVPLFISECSAALTSELSASDVADTVREMADDKGWEPSLIVIDTLARNFGSSDENSAADMNAFISNLDKHLRRPWVATVIVIHHSGKNSSRGARGSTALRGAVDAEYEISRDRSGTIRMLARKMKDAENPEPMAFRLENVELPVLDDDGNPVSGAVLNSIDYIVTPESGNRNLGKNEKHALKVLTELENKLCEQLDDSGYPQESVLVSVKDWKESCGFGTRNIFWKVKNSLVKKGKVCVTTDGHVERLDE